MAHYACLACRGTYSDTNPDRSSYFHVCPPDVLLRVLRLDGTRVTIPRGDLLPGDVIEREIFRPRAGHRDENTREHRDEGGGRHTRVIKAEGAGRREIPRPREDDDGD